MQWGNVCFFQILGSTPLSSDFPKTFDRGYDKVIGLTISQVLFNFILLKRILYFKMIINCKFDA